MSRKKRKIVGEEGGDDKGEDVNEVNQEDIVDVLRQLEQRMIDLSDADL